MMKSMLCLLFVFSMGSVFSQKNFEKDVFKTGMGELSISCIGHGTLMLEVGGKVIHVDPVSREADYSAMPDADLVLITHHHGDHLDAKALDEIGKENTKIILTKSCIEALGENLPGGTKVMQNGERDNWNGIEIDAIPAYNIVNKRPGGEAFHPKGTGNAYVLTFSDFRLLIGGDTENIPEIKELKNIDVAFLPMNLPYTMTPEMVADAARAFKPGILYPYHFGSTDTGKLVELLKDTPEVEVRIRNF